MCFATVSGLSNSLSAISPFVKPRATSLNTSISR